MAVIASLRDRSLIIAEWTLTVFTFSLVLLRVYFRTVQSRWRLSDTFVVIAWVLLCAQVCCETQTFRLGAYSEFAQFTLSLENAVASAKIALAKTICYFSCVYAVKASMLAFYCEIINRWAMPKSFMILRCLVALVISSYIFSICAFLFWCKNISDNWTVDNRFKKCFGAGYDYRISSPVLAMHLLTDLLIYLFPILILKKLNLPPAKKFGAAVLFLLGLISIINALLYFLTVFVIGGKAGLWNPFLAIWEEVSAIVVACCPAFKAFLKARLKPQIGAFFKRSKSWITSTISSKKSPPRRSDEVENGHRGPRPAVFELRDLEATGSQDYLSQNNSHASRAGTGRRDSLPISPTFYDDDDDDIRPARPVARSPRHPRKPDKTFSPTNTSATDSGARTFYSASESWIDTS